VSSLEQSSSKHNGQRNGISPSTAPLQICRPGLGDKGLSALCFSGISTPTSSSIPFCFAFLAPAHKSLVGVASIEISFFYFFAWMCSLFHLFVIKREVTAKTGAVAASLIGHSSLVLANCGVTGLVIAIVFAIMSWSAPP
jgi:hypothetical protein